MSRIYCFLIKRRKRLRQPNLLYTYGLVDDDGLKARRVCVCIYVYVRVCVCV